MNPTKQSLRATLTSIGTNSDRKAVTRRDKRSEKPNSKLSKSLQDATSLLLPKSIRRQSQDFGSSVLRKDESNYSYESLKIAYQSVLNENTCLRDGKINQISKSTVKFENENYEAFSFEIEDLCEVLSNSHKSIQQLLQNIRVSSQDYASLKRKLNLLYWNRELNDSTIEIKLGLLRETLFKKSDDIKVMRREKKKVENLWRDAEKQSKAIESKIKQKESEIQKLEKNKSADQVYTSDLYYKLNKATQNLDRSQMKCERLQQYIKTHYKEKKKM